jgi:TonB family protein
MLKTLNQHIIDIQRCYERELESSPKAEGRVVAEWTIQASGRVGDCRVVSSDIRSVTLSTCVVEAIRGWVFPPPKSGEQVVTYPFILGRLGY